MILLLHKLDYYGISGLVLNWLSSYLKNRQQFIEYSGYKSIKQNIVCGIPQGSILGHLSFIIYINDLPNWQTHTDTLQVSFSQRKFLNHLSKWGSRTYKRVDGHQQTLSKH